MTPLAEDDGNTVVLIFWVVELEVSSVVTMLWDAEAWPGQAVIMVEDCKNEVLDESDLLSKVSQ